MIAFSSVTPYLVETTNNFTSKIHKFDTELSQTMSHLMHKFTYQNKQKTFANPREFDMGHRDGAYFSNCD